MNIQIQSLMKTIEHKININENESKLHQRIHDSFYVMLLISFENDTTKCSTPLCICEGMSTRSRSIFDQPTIYDQNAICAKFRVFCG